MGMLNKKLMGIAAAAMLVSGSSWAVTFSDGGTNLQSMLDTELGDGTALSSGIDVNADQMTDAADSYWHFGDTDASISVILGENTTNFGTNAFGMYNSGGNLQIFKGTDSVGYKALVNYTASTNNISVTLFDDLGGFVSNSGSNTTWFNGEEFGFYLNNGSTDLNSDSSMNGGIDAMVGYYHERFAGESILAFEDFTENDTDYDDFVVIVESVYVPEPATLALLGLGLIGMGFRARRKAA